jgi:hypothetical protein
LPGQPLNTGASSSTTVTLNVQLFVFPAPSSATHVTLVVPTAKLLPLAGAQLTLTAPTHASVAVTT